MAKDPSIERLDLRFRAESAKPRAMLPGGWLVWVLSGVALGLLLSVANKHFLSASLSQQLATTDAQGDAYLAVESLLALDPISSLGIVRGLENADPKIANAAFLALNTKIAQWQQVDSPEADEQLYSLADRLSRLPETTSADGLMHASSLATKMLVQCQAANDSKHTALISLCEQIVRRSGASSLDVPELAFTDASQGIGNRAARVAMPPPPLPSVADSVEQDAADHALANEQYTDSLSDTSDEPPAVEVVPSLTRGPMASFTLVPFGTRPRQAPVALDENSGPSNISSSFSLSDEPALLRTTPSVVISGGDAPLMRMTLSQPESTEGFQGLPIAELVKKLGSTQPQVSQAAALALRGHHWPDEHIALASELATCSAARRLQLVPELATRTDLTNSTWLLWMAESGEPEVRKLSVSYLSSMVEPEVERGLRSLLARERDGSVRLAIQRTLMVSAEQQLRR